MAPRDFENVGVCALIGANWNSDLQDPHDFLFLRLNLEIMVAVRSARLSDVC